MVAILEAPFFAIAHILARPLGYPADGFSRPYQFMIYIGGLLFAGIGLWYLRRLLLYYYSETAVALTLLFLVLGTNYLNYAGIDIGMSHTWLFTLYVLIMLNTHYYYRTLKVKYALSIGALVALTVLVRPTEIIAILIPLLWGMNNFSLSAINKRLLFYKTHIVHFLLTALVGLIGLSIQFLYWKYASCQWLLYTYANQGFSWLRPHVVLYAFNYWCGWLLYTPIMFFVFPALIIFILKGKNKIAILSLILLNYYIVAAWDRWDYGGRAMIQNYAVLLFPIASFMEFLLRKKIALVLAAPFLLLGTYFNLWWTYQAHKGGLVASEPTTSSYYWATILRYDLPLDIQKLRDNEDWYRKRIKEPVLLYSNNFNNENGAGEIMVAHDRQQSFPIALKGKKYKWFRASAKVHIDQRESNVWLMTLFIIKLKKGNVVLQENSIRMQRLLTDNATALITVDAKAEQDSYDTIELSFKNENNGPLPCYMDNIKVIGFDQ